jgi:ketosteroid isomerase-like protein
MSGDDMSEVDNPIDTVRRYVEAFNNADAGAMAAECADPMQILDGMAPHVWQGPTASEEWWADVVAEGEHLGAGAYHITFDTPRHVDVAGDFAYLVIPASMAFTLRGQRHTQTGATYIAAARKIDGRWLLTAWSWAKGH